MIRLILHDGTCAIHLLQKNNSGQLIRKGHLRQRNPQQAFLQNLFRKPFCRTKNKGNIFFFHHLFLKVFAKFHG